MNKKEFIELLQSYEDLRQFFPEAEARAMADDINASLQEAHRLGGTKGLDDIGVGGTFTDIDDAALNYYRNYSLVLSTKESQQALNAMKTTIFTGLQQGKGIDEIARGLRSDVLPFRAKVPKTADELDRMIRNRSRMIARTEVIRASNMGRLDAYRKHDVEKYEWVTELNPCPRCADLEGQQFSTKDRGPMPPLHPNGRCTIIPVIEK